MSIPPGPWRFKLAATVIPAVPPPTIKTLWCVVPAIHGSPVELARPLWLRAFARQTPDHYTQPNVHRRPTRSRRPQIFRTCTTAEAKCAMRGSRLDQAPLSRNAVPRLGVLVLHTATRWQGRI